MSTERSDIVQENSLLVDKYITYISSVRGYSKNTAVSYRHDLSRFEEFCKNHNLSFRDVRFEDSREFCLLINDENLSAETINRITSGCKSFYTYLCQTQVTKIQPFARLSRNKSRRKMPVVLSEEELESLLNAPVDDFTSLMEVTMFNLFYSTGCRLSEIILLKKTEIDMENRRIKVLGKGNKERYAFLSLRAVSWLNRYNTERNRLIQTLHISDPLYFLINKKGKKLPTSSVHVIFDKYKVKLGITKQFTPHVLRHTFATNLLDNDSDIRVVQALLGHESIGTTQIYTNVSRKRLESVYDKAHPHSRRKE